MLKNKYIKVGVSVFLVLMAIWVAVPKVYVHDLLGHDHSLHLSTGETAVNTESSTDCDFEKYDKPVYFSLFKFICSFIPLKSQGSQPINHISVLHQNLSFAISLLRAPPVSE